MRAFGRDLIRGGHYGQRSCEPRQQAEHMAAPTNAAKREESSCQLGAVHTWGTFRTLSVALMMFVHGTKQDVLGTSSERRDCQRNISASSAMTWKPGSLTVWKGRRN